MRSTNLPQPVAVRLLEMDERVTELITKANKADAALTFARDIINGKHEVEREEYQLVQAGFADVNATAKSARQRADAERGILQDVRSWVANLPHNTKLCVVPPANGGELATLQAKLQALREELHKLQNTTMPADDISEKVTAYVYGLAAKAQPWLRGFGAGQQLDIRWPTGPDCNPQNGNGYSNIDGNGLMFAALLQPTALTDAILHAVQATLPMDKVELEKRRSVLPGEIDELSYTVAALRERAGEPPDPNMNPWHYLGVRTKDEEAAPRQQIRA